MYRPKYRAAILKLDQSVREKERRLNEASLAKKKAARELECCEQDIRDQVDRAKTEGCFPPFFLEAAGGGLHRKRDQLRSKVEFLGEEVKALTQEYLMLKTKREWFVTKETEGENLFRQRERMKEEKEVEMVKRGRAFAKRRGET